MHEVKQIPLSTPEIWEIRDIFDQKAARELLKVISQFKGHVILDCQYMQFVTYEALKQFMEELSLYPDITLEWRDVSDRLLVQFQLTGARVQKKIVYMGEVEEVSASEYLNQSEKLEPVSEGKIIVCNECGGRSKIYRSGMHCCPHCQTSFYVDPNYHAKFDQQI